MMLLLSQKQACSYDQSCLEDVTVQLKYSNIAIQTKSYAYASSQVQPAMLQF